MFSTNRSEHVAAAMRALWPLVAISAAVLAGCFFLTPPPSARVDIVAPVYPDPRDAGCDLEVFASPPSAPHKPFAQIAVRGRETQMPKMKTMLHDEACGVGADAVITFIDSSKVQLYWEAYPEWVTNRAPHAIPQNYDFSLIGVAILYTPEEAAAKGGQPPAQAHGGSH